jgi:DNA-3-methyladenine glycosylase
MEKSPQMIVESEKRPVLPGQLLPRIFYEAPPQAVAPLLLGKLLVSVQAGKIAAGRIVEAEAYLGPHQATPDPAAHARNGPTDRNRVLFGAAGHAYIYSIYGRYFCVNVSCETVGKAGCVLLRALEPVAGRDEMLRRRCLMAAAKDREIASGPGRLCQALGLTRTSHNGMDLTNSQSPLQLRDDGYPKPEYRVTTRIGIHVAVDLPLRFAVAGNSCVSGPINMKGASGKPEAPCERWVL